MELFWQDLVNGILVGGIFAVVALGFSLVWGIMNIINLAHGAFIMLGAYLAYVLFTAWHIDPFFSIPLGFVVLFALGYCIQRYVINFVVRAPLLTTFLLTFGLSLLIVNVALLVFHGDTKGITTAYSGANFSIGTVTIAWTKLWTLIVALAITALMHVWLSKSKTGRAIRAMSMDIDAAQLSGVRVSHLYAVVYGLGAGLAGAAGVLISLSYSLQPSMGDPFIITAFVCCILGGLGTVQGALVGGLVFGVVEAFGSQYIGAGLQDAVALVVMLIVLIVRPRGLLGEGHRLMGGITGNALALRVTVGILVLLAFVPLLHSSYYENLGRGVLMFATLGLGWNIIGGYTGYVSFGNVVFFGLGCYTTAALWQHWHQQSIALAIVCAVAIAVAFSLALGMPILRLRGHYFAIATLGIALATQEIVANIDWLGAGSGFAVRPLEAFSSYYFAMWIVCAASMLATYVIARSKLGYAFVAIRENEEAAAVLGVDATGYKIVAWSISAAMAAAAGAVFAGANGFIDPPTAFATDDNVFPIVMALLGGVSTVAGPLIGSLILTAINETLWSHFPQIHTLFFGAVIVLVVLFLPRGLLWLLNTRGGWKRFVATLGAYRV